MLIFCLMKTVGREGAAFWKLSFYEKSPKNEFILVQNSFFLLTKMMLILWLMRQFLGLEDGELRIVSKRQKTSTIYFKPVLKYWTSKLVTLACSPVFNKSCFSGNQYTPAFFFLKVVTFLKYEAETHKKLQEGNKQNK